MDFFSLTDCALDIIEQLDLSNINMSFIPHDLEKYSKLKLLDLSKNRISTLYDYPDNHKLKKLILNGNPLTPSSLPLWILNSDDIEVLLLDTPLATNLDLGYSELCKITKMVNKTFRDNLKSLSMNNCNLTSDIFVDIYNFEKLSDLDLSFNHIKFVDQNIGRYLPLLRNLKISYNDVVSEGLFTPNLETIVYGINRMNFANEGIIVSEKGYIDASYCKLTDFPGLVNPKLRLIGNNITRVLYVHRTDYIDELLGQMPNVRKLTISQAYDLYDFPTSIINMPMLTNLSIFYSPLKNVPDGLGGLPIQFLIIIGSSISYFPNSIAAIPSLKSIIIDHSLQAPLLPDFSQSKNLNTLFIYGNILKQLPDGICDAPNIEYLDFSDGLLTELDNSIGSCNKTKSLSLSYNNLTNLPDVVSNMESLTFLDISYNKFKEVPNGLRNLNLNFLLIQGNPLEFIPAILCESLWIIPPHLTCPCHNLTYSSKYCFYKYYIYRNSDRRAIRNGDDSEFQRIAENEAKCCLPLNF
eukprot:NODE_751_length_2386_cov_37.400795_g642_i0.p1 GENE.NODE_751_length_2386_cov_37.400795_g642_i0~~NODE_751_length_2386_cov_37.400795_g642_i0.p1  ORF type:complete len:524 (-),score=36.06 NODE_751_length_2386_cov_37.400795_g642_i0:391-1962(-)